MKTKNIIEEVKTLLINKKLKEASDLLIKEGFINNENHILQELFYELIPENDEFKYEKENSLKQLFSTDEKTRIKAAQYIFSQARNEYSNTRKNWLGDPRIVEILFEGLNDTNKKVVENVTGALWMISNGGRYLKDIRIYNKLIELLNNRSSNVLFYTIAGLENFKFDSKWELLFKLLKETKNLRVANSIIDSVIVDLLHDKTQDRDYIFQSLLEVASLQKNEKILTKVNEVIDKYLKESK